LIRVCLGGCCDCIWQSEVEIHVGGRECHLPSCLLEKRYDETVVRVEREVVEGEVLFGNDTELFEVFERGGVKENQVVKGDQYRNR
jgi:hypothetical protein